jgi:hypothetical protein
VDLGFDENDNENVNELNEDENENELEERLEDEHAHEHELEDGPAEDTAESRLGFFRSHSPRVEKRHAPIARPSRLSRSRPSSSFSSSSFSLRPPRSRTAEIEDAGGALKLKTPPEGGEVRAGAGQEGLEGKDTTALARGEKVRWCYRMYIPFLMHRLHTLHCTPLPFAATTTDV